MPLRTAKNDARAVRSALTEAGFNVEIVEDADRATLERAIDNFVSKVGPIDDAFFYYAGRAETRDGLNYLLPIDSGNYPVADLQKKLEERRAASKLIVLDACRNGGGLTGMVAAPGTLIAFAAAAGQQSIDDPLQPVDLFTKDLAAALAPFQNGRDLFYRVQKAVNEDSTYQQLPYISEGPRTPSISGLGVHPPMILVQVQPDYSDEARVAKISGQVVVRVYIDANGDVTQVDVVRGLGMGLDEKAVEAVKKWKFKPGTKDGKPVTTSANIVMNFRL